MTKLTYRMTFAGLFLCLFAAPASAYSVVTYVSGKGVDTGACATPATACRTFQFALNQTFPGGEIKALDAADYFPVTINRSVSITGVEGAGITRFKSGNAITINAGTGVFNISNLSLDGFNRTATNGVVVTSGGKLTIVNCKVRRFSGIGIQIVPTSGATDVSISDAIVSDNGSDGINMSAATGTDINAVISRTTFASNSGSGVIVTQVATSAARAMVIDSIALKNGIGYAASGSGGPELILRRSVAMRNAVGLSGGGTAATYGDNSIDSNTTDLGGTILSWGTK